MHQTNAIQSGTWRVAVWNGARSGVFHNWADAKQSNLTESVAFRLCSDCDMRRGKGERTR
ncbi:ribonuclease H1 domain-containing protein [Devosia sp.]|uniref:ribonuclease H1 domain-containing protein n=1 Tax=Devosia TaxID=46913 RepID=UPI003F50A848